jgi:dUTP pyrophosphatase
MTDKNNPVILVKRIVPDAKLPVRALPTDSGLDVFVQDIRKVYDRSSEEQDPTERFIEGKGWRIGGGDRFLIDTGIIATVGIPGYEIQVRTRSGSALKLGLRVENSPGTIDCNYRGMLGVILINDSCSNYMIKKHERIAQIVVCRVELLTVEEVDELPVTDRGEGGFGHTGT